MHVVNGAMLRCSCGSVLPSGLVMLPVHRERIENDTRRNRDGWAAARGSAGLAVMLDGYAGIR
ncbi:MAG: hypothetical protein ACREEZ_05355 [Stellaceae bacterium]